MSDLFEIQLEPIIRLYAKNGFRKPAEVSRLLNKEHRRTACGESWTPRLAWFLLKLSFGSSAKVGHRSVRKKHEAIEPRSIRAATAKAEVASASTDPISPLTKEEIAKRLSAIARVIRES
jgi:hypothetical protein